MIARNDVTAMSTVDRLNVIREQILGTATLWDVVPFGQTRCFREGVMRVAR